MGLFCVNFHFRTEDQSALAASLKKRKIANHRILPAKNGWISLLEERASDQDDRRIRQLAGDISKDLKSPAIAFMVHDSDIACYWLYDRGRLLDEFNSCPDYFDDDGGGGSPACGNPKELLRFCLPGTSEVQLAEILGEEGVFAEGVIERLAAALGIDVNRALADYRHDDDELNDDGDNDDLGEDGPPSGGGGIRAMIAGRIGQMFGGGSPSPPADPRQSVLVDAAVDGDGAEIDRLLEAGAAIDGVAPAPLAARDLGPMGFATPIELPKMSMTPLLAAVTHKQREAVARLLDRGADPNFAHPLFGSAAHVAAGSGEVELLRLLIERGADVNLQNARGQTPLQVIAASRGVQDQLAQAQATMKAMGAAVPDFVQRLAMTALPIEGWKECERLLFSQGER